MKCGTTLGDKPEDAYTYNNKILCPTCYNKAIRDEQQAKGKLILEKAKRSPPPKY
jgi:hypothetical protein